MHLAVAPVGSVLPVAAVGADFVVTGGDFAAGAAAVAAAGVTVVGAAPADLAMVAFCTPP